MANLKQRLMTFAGVFAVAAAWLWEGRPETAARLAEFSAAHWPLLLANAAAALIFVGHSKEIQEVRP